MSNVLKEETIVESSAIISVTDKMTQEEITIEQQKEKSERERVERAAAKKQAEEEAEEEAEKAKKQAEEEAEKAKKLAKDKKAKKAAKKEAAPVPASPVPAAHVPAVADSSARSTVADEGKTEETSGDLAHSGGNLAVVAAEESVVAAEESVFASLLNKVGGVLNDCQNIDVKTIDNMMAKLNKKVAQQERDKAQCERLLPQLKAKYTSTKEEMAKLDMCLQLMKTLDTHSTDVEFVQCTEKRAIICKKANTIASLIKTTEDKIVAHNAAMRANMQQQSKVSSAQGVWSALARATSVAVASDGTTSVQAPSPVPSAPSPREYTDEELNHLLDETSDMFDSGMTVCWYRLDGKVIFCVFIPIPSSSKWKCHGHCEDRLLIGTFCPKCNIIGQAPPSDALPQMRMCSNDAACPNIVKGKICQRGVHCFPVEAIVEMRQ
jgi:hypothetical protein